MVDKTECHTKMAAKAPEATLETPRTRMKRRPDSAKNSAQNSLRNSARTALETKHGSAQNGAEIALDDTQDGAQADTEAAPESTSSLRPQRSATAHDDIHRYSIARCYQPTNLPLSDADLQCRSAMVIRHEGA